jgi:hypothetical protein
MDIVDISTKSFREGLARGYSAGAMIRDRTRLLSLQRRPPQDRLQFHNEDEACLYLAMGREPHRASDLRSAAVDE